MAFNCLLQICGDYRSLVINWCVLDASQERLLFGCPKTTLSPRDNGTCLALTLWDLQVVSAISYFLQRLKSHGVFPDFEPSIDHRSGPDPPADGRLLRHCRPSGDRRPSCTDICLARRINELG
jgi:hypothetical protein